MTTEEMRLAKDRHSLDKALQLKNQANDEYQKHNYPYVIGYPDPLQNCTC